MLACDFGSTADRIRVVTATGLYQVGIKSGKATMLEQFSASTTITAIAIPVDPVTYAVDDMNDLLIFIATVTTSPVITSEPITGMPGGETVLGLDRRLSNGQFYALGSTSRLYHQCFFWCCNSCGDSTTASLLSGTHFGFNFNLQ